MAIIKCKMCGGDLSLAEGISTAECEFCGSVQTIPNLDDEKKLIQFERAERLRKQCEFDKAAGIYETIVADFRQEAEAYWGLVLCKFGIEYVDDPATGKKIPTCHRSSFDSILDDSDFEQALENADPAARKVYREEAKQIEGIRKGIIAVSNNEQPYDIFICYKETDEKGERTLDSVLAQDIYDALTDKGYRVFFARITLEDKLGMEYEPYIFAALNSAKIMLAVGTDYEYFNAVWVKNEWSRYLKLMAKDKDKHLIPCFKGIDAYDMPREFARLQAQDLGKVGAMQDLLRGIDKILPRQQQNTTVIQERVVVGGSGSNKIASLLDRGNMALEDGDWAKADSFFEDVLNNDSKNAQAYLGKTLAQEKCRTIDAFVRKRKDTSQAEATERLRIQPATDHIDQMVQQYSIPGYVGGQDVRNLYQFDLSYATTAPCRKKQYRQEETYWAEHKLLSKAEKFAVGAVAENLQREKKALFAALSERVKKAETAEAAAQANVQQRYDVFVAQADQKAAKLYEDGLKAREGYYQTLLQTAKTATDVKILTQTAQQFAELGDYQDSKDLAEHCRKRAEEEQAKLDAQAEQQRLIKLRQEKERKAKAKRKAILAACITCTVVVAIVFVYILNTVIIPNQNYSKAVEQMDAGNYETAIEMFTALNGYKDSAAKIEACETAILEETYQEALVLLNNKKFQESYDLFSSLAAYRDAKDMMLEVRYQEGLYFWEQKEFERSNPIFQALGSYKDSKERIHTHQFTSAVETQPLCETDGVMRYSCTDCALFYTEPIAATGHTFSETVQTEPGCETAGTMLLSCACGHSETAPIAALGHSYDDGKVEKTATCTATGVKRYTCHCGTSFTEEIPKTEHNYKSKVTTAATCEESGVKTFTCSGCSASYTEKIKATGHNYDNGKITTSAKCDKDGVKTFTCINCPEYFTETVPSLGHNYGAASCDQGGKCSRCAAQSEPLGHTTMTGTCDRCNYNFTAPITLSGGFTMGGKVYDAKLSRGRYALTIIIEGWVAYEDSSVNLYYEKGAFNLVDIYDKNQKDGTYYDVFELTQDISELWVRCDRYGVSWTFIITPIN